MKPTRAHPCVALIAAFWLLSACATLPDVGDAGDRVAPKPVPTVATAEGPLAPNAARALLARQWTRSKLDLKAQAALEEAITGEPLIAGNKVALLFDGPQTLKEMAAAISAAKDHINLETYIFDQDQLGIKFADLLIEKQQQGVTVNIMYDAVGTIGTPNEFFERMRAAGIRLVEFNPINPAARTGHKWRLNNRDHRKILIVDGKVGFTGGINISNDYAASSPFRSKRPPKNGAHFGWRDTHIKIEGPAVAALQWLFINAWVRQGGPDLPERDFFPTLKPAGDRVLRVIATRPGGGFEIYRAFILAIQEAKQTIHITSAYFVPDVQIIEALGKAARKGIDVKLVVPGKSDVGLVLYAGRASYDALLEHGVRIFELQHSVLHAKTAVVDGAWSTVGSTNIDTRSFLHNYELNVVVVDTEFGRAMESAFAEDLRNSVELTREKWDDRPWVDRIKEWAASLFNYWL